MHLFLLLPCQFDESGSASLGHHFKQVLPAHRVAVYAVRKIAESALHTEIAGEPAGRKSDVGQRDAGQ
jgi:hypothetical protein